jgi:hypothetical protein
MTGQQARSATSTAPAARRRELYGLLGSLPDRKRPIAGKKRSEEEHDGYVLETWDLDLNGIETVPAYLARPRTISGRVPGVLFNHSHGGGYKIGKQEFIEGRSYLDKKPYAKELTELGYVALCIDSWIFGERSHTSELDMFKAMLWEGQVLWGMMVYDGLRALDFLLTLPGSRSTADCHARHVDGQHHGVVPWRARRADQGHGRYQLPDRFPGAPCAKGAGAPRRVLFRAQLDQAFHHRPDQCLDRAAGAPRTGGTAR